MPFKFTPGPERIAAIQSANDYADQTKPENNISDQEFAVLGNSILPRWFGIQTQLMQAVLKSTATGQLIPLSELWQDQESQPGPLNLIATFEIGQDEGIVLLVNVMEFACGLAACPSLAGLSKYLQAQFGTQFRWSEYNTKHSNADLLAGLGFLRSQLTSWQDTTGYAQPQPTAPAPDQSIIARPLT